MRKHFILMLIIALTLQLSWTVASAFCLHETDSSAQHFGHHPHQHSNLDVDETEIKPSANKSTSHPDCATCSHVTSLAMEAQENPLSFSARLDFNSLNLLQPPIPFLGEPERPKWLRLA